MIQSQAEAALLPETCSILRATFTTTTQGGQTQTWATLASGVACFADVGMMGFGGSETPTGADRIMPSSGWTIALPFDQDVTAKDRIQVTSLADRTFEVNFVSQDSWLMLTNCSCQEIL